MLGTGISETILNISINIETTIIRNTNQRKTGKGILEKVTKKTTRTVYTWSKCNNIKAIIKTNERQINFTGSIPRLNRIHCFLSNS